MSIERSRRFLCRCALGCALLSATTFSSFGKEYQCVRFTAHGKPTSAVAINNQGTVVGTYVDDSGQMQGFLRAPNGDITDVRYSGAISTRPTGINDYGDIAGTYIDAENSTHGFLRASNGSFTDFLPLLPDGQPAAEVRTGGINNRGEISGTLFYPGNTIGALPFARGADGGIFQYQGEQVNGGGMPSGMNDEGTFFVTQWTNYFDVSNQALLSTCVGGGCGPTWGYGAAYAPYSGIGVTRVVGANNDGKELGSIEYRSDFEEEYIPGPRATFIRDRATDEAENVACPGIDPFAPVFNGLSNDERVAGQINDEGIIATPTGRTAELHLSATLWTFAAHIPGSIGGYGRIYVYNQGNAPAHIVKIDQYYALTFPVTENHCQGQLNPGQTCDFAFAFKPDIVGLNEGKIFVASDGEGAMQVVNVRGVGSGTAFEMPRGFATFPIATRVGTQATYPVTFYPYNYGNTPGPLRLKFEGGAQQDFPLLEDTCSANVAPYTTCKLVFGFKPTQSGYRSVEFSTPGWYIDLTGWGY